MTNRAWMLAALFAVTGCATLGPPKPRMPFPEEEFASLPRNEVSGAATLKGQAFLMTRGGDVKKGAGREITLVPYTSYAQQWLDVSCNGYQRLTPPDTRYLSYVRTATADGDGRFAFARLPAGKYVASAIITWEVGATVQGGCVAKVVQLADGAEAEVVLTR